MSALSDLLNSQPISARRAAELAEDQNLRLPYGTIAAYWSGKHGRPSLATLERLATVLNMPIEKLQQAAWNATAPLGPWEPTHESVLLNQRQRYLLDELIKSIVVTRGVSDGVEDATQPDASSKANEIEEAKLVDGAEVSRERGRRAGPDAAARARAKGAQNRRQQG